MEGLATVLPIIIYFLLIILLVVGIILGIKIIITIDKVNVVVDDLTKKIKTLGGVFNLVDAATNKVGYLTSKVIDGVMSVVNKIIGLRKRKEEDDFYE